MDTNGKQRIPATPLPYSMRHKAGPNELLADYTTTGGYNRIYISDSNKNLIDITAQIIDKIEHAEADNSTIIIEGYGTANLQDFINLLNKKIGSSVQMVDIGANMNYVQKENRIDNESIEIKNKYIQLKGFDTAVTGSIPVKSGNSIIWIQDESISKSDGSSENPTDGLGYSTLEQNIVAGKVYLQASIRQKTTTPSKDFGVKLPDTEDEFCQIQWLLVTNSFVPNITFSDNCLWRSLSSAKLKANSYHLFKFVTYNKGLVWLAESTIYAYTSSDIANETDYYTVVADK